MLTIIDFFRKKGDFRRNFIFQCGINHAPFVMVLSFGASKRNLRGFHFDKTHFLDALYLIRPAILRLE